MGNSSSTKFSHKLTRQQIPYWNYIHVHIPIKLFFERDMDVTREMAVAKEIIPFKNIILPTRKKNISVHLENRNVVNDYSFKYVSAYQDVSPIQHAKARYLLQEKIEQINEDNFREEINEHILRNFDNGNFVIVPINFKLIEDKFICRSKNCENTEGFCIDVIFAYPFLPKIAKDIEEEQIGIAITKYLSNLFNKTEVSRKERTIPVIIHEKSKNKTITITENLPVTDVLYMKKDKNNVLYEIVDAKEATRIYKIYLVSLRNLPSQNRIIKKKRVMKPRQRNIPGNVKETVVTTKTTTVDEYSPQPIFRPNDGWERV